MDVRPRLESLIPSSLIAFFAEQIFFGGSATHYLLGHIVGLQARILGLAGMIMGILGVWDYVRLALSGNKNTNRAVRNFCILYVTCLLLPLVLLVCRVSLSGLFFVTRFVVSILIIVGATVVHNRVCKQ